MVDWGKLMRSSSLVMLGFLGCLFVALTVQASPRTWTDAQGRTTKADFVRVYRGKVVLLRGNRVLMMPLGSLSQQDQQYVAQQLEPKGPRLFVAEKTPPSGPSLLKSSAQASAPVCAAPIRPTFAEDRRESRDSEAKAPSPPRPSPSLLVAPSQCDNATSSPPAASPTRRPNFGRMTVEEANGLIVDQLYRETGKRDVPRQKSFNAADFADATKLVRVEQDNVPILGAPDFTGSKLDVLGVASVGEVFALVDQQGVLALMNPLSSAPDRSGLWYKVRMLDGSHGWIFAEPQGHQGPPLARSFAVANAERAEPTGKGPDAQQAVRDLAKSIYRPIGDPKVSVAQRVGRAIGVMIGGVLAVLFVIAVFVAVLSAATGRGPGWRWWWDQGRRLLTFG